MKAYSKIYILATLIIPFVFSNCGDRKDPCEETKHYYFFVKPEEKAVLPYKGFDTLRLKHSSGAEYTFYAGAIDSLFTITAKATSPDCANNIIEHRQGYNITFNSSNYSSPLSINLTNIYTTGTSVLDVSLKKGLTFKTIVSLDFPPPPSPVYDFDSLLINGKIYNNIQLIYTDNNNHSEKLFFNTQFGILKLAYSNGETWERIP